jgi:hypothetical protein
MTWGFSNPMNYKHLSVMASMLFGAAFVFAASAQAGDGLPNGISRQLLKLCLFEEFFRSEYGCRCKRTPFTEKEYVTLGRMLKVLDVIPICDYPRWVLGHSLEHQRHEGDAVGETKKSRADSEQLALR